MKDNIKTKWIKALRSGKFLQGRGHLKKCRGRGNQPSYCCLGVLRGIIHQYSKLMQGGDAYLNNKHLEEVGLDNGTQRTLAQFNDSGRSFKIIADYIEQKV